MRFLLLITLILAAGCGKDAGKVIARLEQQLAEREAELAKARQRAEQAELDLAESRRTAVWLRVENRRIEELEREIARLRREPLPEPPPLFPELQPVLSEGDGNDWLELSDKEKLQLSILIHRKLRLHDEWHYRESLASFYERDDAQLGKKIQEVAELAANRRVTPESPTPSIRHLLADGDGHDWLELSDRDKLQLCVLIQQTLQKKDEWYYREFLESFYQKANREDNSLLDRSISEAAAFAAAVP